uniref:Uncharacterized protein n=1 Tax=Clytia hemisphaerica TaxID=252671 RepID=A0A7M5WRS5_9CNID|eukprot:TCONS_00047811-protein
MSINFFAKRQYKRKTTKPDDKDEKENDGDEATASQEKKTNIISLKSKKLKKNTSTLEQERRRLGDMVKAKIHFEKYAVKANCTCTCKDISKELFEKLIVPNSSSVTPETFTKETPVVVATVKGPLAAAEILGKTKIKATSRFECREIQKMDIVFYPPQERVTMWWTMYTDFDDSEEED